MRFKCVAVFFNRYMIGIIDYSDNRRSSRIEFYVLPVKFINSCVYVTLISGYVTNSMVNNDIVPMITK